MKNLIDNICVGKWMSLLYFVVLFEYKIYFLSIADIAMLLLLVYAMFQNRNSLKSIVVFKEDIFFFSSFFIVVCINLFFLINAEYFDYNTFLFAFAKFIFYSSLVFVLPNYLKFQTEKLEVIVRNLIIVICLLGLYQYVAHHLFPSLPYSLNFNNWGNYDAIIDSRGMFRIKSVFSEPSHFAVMLISYYSFLVFRDVKLTNVEHLLVAITVYLTKTFCGYFLYMVFLNLIIIKRNKNSIKKVVVLYSLVLFFLLGIIYLNEPLMARVMKIVALRDNSAMIRIVGGWEVASQVVKYGLGFGNISNFIDYHPVGYFTFLYSVNKINNIFAVVLALNGLSGLLLFVFYICKKFWSNRYLLLVFISACFLWGQFNNIVCWFFVILYSSDKMSKMSFKFKNEKIEM